MLEMIGNLLEPTTIGGIFGGAMGWLTKREERENVKLKYKHDVVIANINKESKKLDISHKEAMIDRALEEIDIEGFQESQKVQENVFAKFTNVVRALVRPIVLTMLLYQCWVIGEFLLSFKENLTADEIREMLNSFIYAIFNLTAIAVGWYFGTRSSTQFNTMMKK